MLQIPKEALTVADPFPEIVGQTRVKSELASALLAGRHVLIVGPSGVGKTTLAREVARLLPRMEVADCGFNCEPDRPICPRCSSGKAQPRKVVEGSARFIRVQGSPDLTAEDLIGDIDPGKAMVFGPLSIEAFSPGKLFKANNGVLFFDELNRAPEKLQNALLQALEERKVTIGSYDVDLESNFIFIATMNPGDSSTEKLSEVLLDRFDLVRMGYPESIEQESEIVLRKGRRAAVHFPNQLLKLGLAFVRALRAHKQIERAPSVRATIGLYERAQANAVLRGSREVELQDLTAAMLSVLGHRIKLKPAAEYAISTEAFVEQEFKAFLEANKNLGGCL